MAEEERRGFMIYRKFHWLTKEELPSTLGIPIESAETVWEKGVRPPAKEGPPHVEEEKTYLIRDKVSMEVEEEEGVKVEPPIETPLEEEGEIPPESEDRVKKLLETQVEASEEAGEEEEVS